MLSTCHTNRGRATLGVALIALMGACSDTPSAPPEADYVLHGGRTTASREESEPFAIRTHVTAEGMPDVAHDFSTTARHGVATLEGKRFRAEDDGEVAPVPLRVVHEGQVPPAFMRTPRVEVRLPDGRVAVVSRELSADGVPLALSVRVGDDEWRWRRTWDAQKGRVILRQSVVETTRHGRVVTRADVTVSPGPVALAAPSMRVPFSLDLLKRYSTRFGSIATTVLLPRAAQAQSNAGKVCNAAAVSLGNAWFLWRTALLWWSINIAIGTPNSLAVATMGLLGASAAVDYAEASYIDCYVQAAKAGLSLDKIALPSDHEAVY